MMKFLDRANIGQINRTSDGYIATQARAVRSGVQEYLALEFGDMAVLDGFSPFDVVRVYRPPESVFSKDSLISAVHIPVTVDHPAELVTPENYASLAVGEVSTDVVRDGEFVAFSIMVKDKRGIDAIEAGKVELSAGYTAELNRVDHADYDYVMGLPRYNHLAIVDKARAGQEARIGDSAHKQWGAAPLSKPKQKDTKMVDIVKVMIGDKAVSVAATDADIVTKLITDHAAEVAELKTEIADRDAAIGEKMAEIKNLEAKMLTDADIEAKAIERASVIDKAKKMIDGFNPEGKTVEQIKRESLASVYDAEKVAGFPIAAVDSMFDVIEVEAATPDPVMAAAKGAEAKRSNVNDNGQSAYEQRLSDAWKGKK